VGGGSGDPSAVLLTGVYGSGKSTVAAEIAGILEARGLPYGALDLDWLGWFDNGELDHHGAGWGVMYANLSAVVGNYRRAGVRLFVLAWSVPGTAELDAIRAHLAMPLRVVRLTVPLAQIEQRLRADVTTERRDDLREAAEWIATSRGVGVEDLTVTNEGPIRQVATTILEWLGWR
jgi:energy-coupling factor transporter ATP-binding protein EcfA2